MMNSDHRIGPMPCDPVPSIPPRYLSGHGEFLTGNATDDPHTARVVKLMAAMSSQHRAEVLAYAQGTTDRVERENRPTDPPPASNTPGAWEALAASDARHRTAPPEMAVTTGSDVPPERCSRALDVVRAAGIHEARIMTGNDPDAPQMMGVWIIDATSAEINDVYRAIERAMPEVHNFFVRSVTP